MIGKFIYRMAKTKSFLQILFLYLLLLLVLLLLLLGQNHPVVLVVVLVPALVEQLLEHRSHLRVHWSLVESQVPASAQVFCELRWVTLAQHFN